MELEKQKLLISYLISSQEIFVKVSPILNTGYFDPQIKKAVNFIKSYFDDYKAPPTTEQIRAETSITIETKQTLSRQEIQYAEKEIESFCRNKAIEQAIYASPALLKEERFGEIEKLIRSAITVGLSRNIGINYFEDPERRLRELCLNQAAIPTLWSKLDFYLGEGLNRKEMIIFAAPPGVGKSLTMANLAKNLLSQKLNGIYITLELSEGVVAKRFDSMFSGIKNTELLKNITEASIKIKREESKYGSLHIKRMPESSTNANHIRAYLKEFEIVNGFVPDFLCVDYMDLMASVQSISAENTFARDKFISEELRSIADEYNLIMITASQLNRSAQQVDNVEDVSQAHIAGGISKVNTTDNMIAILQTPTMKARGEMMFKLLKTRSSDGVGNFYMLRFNPKTLCLEDLEDDLPKESSIAKAVNDYKKSSEKPKNSLDINNLPFQI